MRQMLLLTEEDILLLRGGKTITLTGNGGEVLLGYYPPSTEPAPTKIQRQPRAPKRESVRYCRRCPIPRKFTGPNALKEYNRHYAAVHLKSRVRAADVPPPPPPPVTPEAL